MRVDLSKTFENVDGKRVVAMDTQKELTLKQVLIQACLAGNTPEAEKIQRYSIYRTLQKAGNGIVNLKAEDIVILKRAILQISNVLIAGQTHDMLDGAGESATEDPFKGFRPDITESAQAAPTRREAI
jgi:hypothetical protein